MKSSEYKNRLYQLESILLDTNFLLQNQDIPIHHLHHELFPDEINFIFKPIAFDHFSLQEKTVMSSEGEISEIDLCLKDKDVNALKQIVDFAKQFASM